ncbi:LysR family transcriptional regulator [Candidatus Roizmanbacteria bacterium]|nr:LysR family transcriptional regulator [Candidatus Roizmanbacteria bacterium]
MITELNRFIQVAKNGNLTKTAESLFITQSALSQSIKRLEQELDTKLFTQKGKTLHITPDGAAISEIGERIIELWEKLKTPKARTFLKPTFTIGVFDNAALRLGKYFQNNLKKDNTNLELIIDTSGKLLSKLQFGVLDLAICIVDEKFLDKNIMLLKTFTEKLLPVSLIKFKDEIQSIPFILYNKDSHTRKQIDEVFIKKGISPNIYAESTSVTFMKQLAILGSGIALLPENLVAAELQQGILKKQKLPISFQRKFGLYIQKNGRLTKDNSLIKDLIKNLR